MATEVQTYLIHCDLEQKYVKVCEFKSIVGLQRFGFDGIFEDFFNLFRTTFFSGDVTPSFL